MKAKAFNIHQAKTHLSRLLKKVAAGEEVIIAKAGKPIAKLVPVGARVRPRQPGGWEGRVWVADDFDAPLPPELLVPFTGGSRDG